MRWLIRSVLALSLLVFLAVAAVFLIPSDRIAGLAADRFAEITGRRLVIEGAVRPTVWPVLGVQTGPVSVSNADWSEGGDMLRAEGLSIALDMAALIGGEVKITGIRAEAPRLLLERARDGRENWVFGGQNGGSAAPGMPGEGTPFTLDLAEVTDGSFTFVDQGTGTRIDLTGLDGQIRIPAFAGEASFALTAVMNGQDLALEGKIGAFAPFLDGKVVPLDLALKAGGADLAFGGRAGWNPLAAEGDLTADLGDLAALSALVGAAAPDLPAGLGAGGITAAGRLTVTDKMSVHLRGGTLTLDDNRLTVDADLTTGGERPKLSAQVAAGTLSLAGLIGGQGGDIGGGARGGTQAAGWPTAPIDVSALGALDATVALSAEAVDLGLARFGATRVVTTIDRARAVFDLRQVAAYQGNISGQFVVNGRGGLSVGGDLVLADLAMQPLLMDLGGYDRLIGTGDLRLKFLGVGNSVDAIMRSLSGSGSLSLGKGELRGLDIAGMLRTLDAGFVGEGQKTIFETISASFTMDQGVLSNSDLDLKAPYVTATGSGTINLGARTLDYRLRPVALAAVDGTGGVMVPLLITGPWAKPTFRLDLESLARERLEEEARALEARAKAEALEAEARAKAELERKAEEELGIVRQEGESMEDAARRRAQEAIDAEAGRLLERLLGGN
jgi:AsmA protein